MQEVLIGVAQCTFLCLNLFVGSYFHYELINKFKHSCVCVCVGFFFSKQPIAMCHSVPVLRVEEWMLPGESLTGDTVRALVDRVSGVCLET